jgi:hypothetical protein
MKSVRRVTMFWLDDTLLEILEDTIGPLCEPVELGEILVPEGSLIDFGRLEDLETLSAQKEDLDE